MKSQLEWYRELKQHWWQCAGLCVVSWIDWLIDWLTRYLLIETWVVDVLPLHCPHRRCHYSYVAFYCENLILNKNLRQWDWHISTHADPTSSFTRFHERRITSVTFTSVHLYGNVYMLMGVARALADCPVLGFWGSKVHKNAKFTALDADEPPREMWRR